MKRAAELRASAVANCSTVAKISGYDMAAKIATVIINAEARYAACRR
jgi:hypothetical protein